MVENRAHTEAEPHPRLLKDLLIEATFAQNRCIDGVKTIALGSLNFEAQKLLTETLVDPQGRERGAPLIVKPGKLFIKKSPEIGSNHAVWGQITYAIDPEVPANAPKALRQDQFQGAILHSHSHDFPPSVTDLADVLLNDEIHHAATAVFVVTSSQKIILFRGKESPQLSEEDSEKEIRHWKQVLNDMLKCCSVSDIAHEEAVETYNVLAWTILREIAKKHNLKIFTGPVEEDYVSLLEL